MIKRIFILATVILLVSETRAQELKQAESLFIKYYEKQHFDSALYFAEEAAAIARGTIGEKNIQYSGFLRYLALSNYNLGRYKKALIFINREMALRESLKKNNDTDYVKSLLTAAIFNRKAGDYEAALQLVQKADKKGSSLFGTSGIEYAEILYNYAGVYHDYGCSVNDMVYINQELRYLTRAIEIFKKEGESGAGKLVQNKIDLAALYNNIGNSPQAEILMQEAIKDSRLRYGERSAGYASALNNMGVLFYNSGQYKYAEKYLVEAADIFKSLDKPLAHKEAICLNNLGAFYYNIGNYKVANQLITRCRNIMESESLTDNPVYSVVLSNLAAITLLEEYYTAPALKSPGRLNETGRLLSRSDSIFRNNCQEPHTYHSAIISNRAIWYNLNGDTKTSMTMLTDLALDTHMSLKVLPLMNKMDFSARLPLLKFEEESPDILFIPVTVDLLDQVSADNSRKSSAATESDPMVTGLIRLVLGDASNIKKTVGIYHPAYGMVLKSLIVAYANIDDTKMEEDMNLEYMNVLNQKIMRDFSFLSENEKELYFTTKLPDLHSFMSYSLSRMRTNPAITGPAFNNLLLYKGLMLKSGTAMRVAILNSSNQELLKKYDDWMALQKKISALYSTPVEYRDQDVTVLVQQANDLEGELVAGSQEFSDYRKGMMTTWQDVQKTLNTEEAAIEFIDFRRQERDGGNVIIYCALILRPGFANPVMVKLFEEQQLSAIIENEAVNDHERINYLYGTRVLQDDKLYNLIWKPLEAHLKGVTSVYISPSGLLNKVSFPSISKGKGVYLCDAFNLQVKGSTGTNTQTNLFAQGSSSALVFGGITYSESSSGDPVWNYLEGTRNEGDAVSSILASKNVNVKYLSGTGATETFFKENAGSFSILHLATHGFFFGDPAEVRVEEERNVVEYGEVEFRGSSRSYGASSFVNNENPLMRSGIVLAGANDVWEQTEVTRTDDGVLTAQEVTQIDMRKSDLVVLSACETGLGEIKGTEGVYGLQRSLKIAGVKYLISSLWQIPDKETVEFMQSFYRNLLDSKDIRKAFFKTQREMRAKYDPYFWGAFVLQE